MNQESTELAIETGEAKAKERDTYGFIGFTDRILTELFNNILPII